MISKKQIFDGNGEFGRTERVHLTLLTDELKDLYMSNRYPGKYGNTDVLDDFFESIWKISNSEDVITFCLWENETNDYVGYCNFNDLNGDPQIGIELIEKYQNIGLGKEICTLLIEKFFKSTNESILYYKSYRNNTRSCCLAEKIGGTLAEIKALSPELEEMAFSMPDVYHIDFRALDILVYKIHR